MTPYVLAVIWLAALPAWAQQPPPGQPDAAAKPTNPQMQAAQAAFDALGEADRKQIQDDLIWASNFTATISGQYGPRTHAAILNFQKAARLPQTGIMDERQRAVLKDAAAKSRASNRLTMQADPRTGASLPIPGALFTKRETLATGTRWESSDAQVVLETGVGRGGADELPAAFERFITLQAPGRRVTYKLLRPDFFVVAGEINNRQFYVRYAVGPNNLRGYALSYPAARSRELERTVIAIANGFQAVPGTAASAATAPAATAPTVAVAVAPPLETPGTLPPGLMLTGVVIAPGRILTGSLASACTDLTIGGRPARLIRPGTATQPAELAADLTGTRPLAATATTAQPQDAILVIGFAGGDRPALSVTSGTIVSTGNTMRVAVPLTREGGGGLVLDRRGNVLGMMQAPRKAPRLVAGFVPASSHPALPAAQLGLTPAGAASSTSLSAGAIIQSVAGSLVAVSCGQPVSLPND